jgi:hypothetical protein
LLYRAHAASNPRDRQPVTEIAQELARLVDKPYFDGLLRKAPRGASLKNLSSKAEKIEAIGDSFSVQDIISYFTLSRRIAGSHAYNDLPT